MLGVYNSGNHWSVTIGFYGQTIDRIVNVSQSTLDFSVCPEHIHFRNANLEVNKTQVIIHHR